MNRVVLTGRIVRAGLWALLLLPPLPVPADGQEARRRWERMNQMRREKFDVVLPEVMRENGIDMWITMRREGLDDPLTPDFGPGYVNPIGYYIFTDRGGERIERAALGIGGYLLAGNGAEWLYPANSRLLLIKSDPAARRTVS